LVELAPHYDHSGASTAWASKVLRELIITSSL
ncbi:MAG: agmatinase, partial [Firmicutes bacterium]|nr:agmatinase [Bacillota bacterium]